MKPFLEDFEGFYLGGWELCAFRRFLVGSPFQNLIILLWVYVFGWHCNNMTFHTRIVLLEPSLKIKGLEF